HVANGGNQVVVQVFRASRNVFLHQREAKTLGDAAVNLALNLRRVDGAADVVGGDDLVDLHGPELRIDLDRGKLRGEAIGLVSNPLSIGVKLRGFGVIVA